jgi:hypothetical protein
MKFFVCGDSDAPSNSAVRYNAIYGPGRSGWQIDETYVTVPMPTAGTFRYLRVGGTDPGSGKTRKFTIRKNGADTSLEVTLTNGNPVVEAYGSVDFAAGDLISLMATPTGSPTNGSFEWDIGYDTDDNTETIILPSSGSGVVLASSGRYISMSGDTSGDTNTEFDASLVMPMSGTFTGLYAYQIDPPGAGDSRIYTLVKNGVDTTITCTISGASDTTASDFAHSFTVAAGDTVSLRIDEGGTTSNVRIKCGIIFKPDNPSLFICSGNSPSNMTVGPFYNYIATGFSLMLSALGKYNRPNTRWVALNNHVKLDVAPGVGQSRSFRSYTFLGQPGFNTTISGTATSASSEGSLIAGYNFVGVPIPNTQLWLEVNSSAGVATASAIWSYSCKDRLAYEGGRIHHR